MFLYIYKNHARWYISRHPAILMRRPIFFGWNRVNESAGSGLAGLQHVGINCCSGVIQHLQVTHPQFYHAPGLRKCLLSGPKRPYQPGFACAELMRNLWLGFCSFRWHRQFSQQDVKKTKKTEKRGGEYEVVCFGWYIHTNIQHKEQNMSSFCFLFFFSGTWLMPDQFMAKCTSCNQQFVHRKASILHPTITEGWGHLQTPPSLWQIYYG